MSESLREKSNKRILVLANNDVGLYRFRKDLLAALLGAGHEVYISLPDGGFISELVQLGCHFIDTPIDRRGMTVTVAGEPVALSATEYRLVETFLDHAGQVLTREQLLAHVWGSAEWGDARVVDVNIQRLRVKVGAQRIETLRGLGYKWPRP